MPAPSTCGVFSKLVEAIASNSSHVTLDFHSNSICNVVEECYPPVHPATNDLLLCNIGEGIQRDYSTDLNCGILHEDT